MKQTCLWCGAPDHKTLPFAWRGYYHFRCENGHRSRLATPKKAAENWARLWDAQQGIAPREG